jgi:aryl-alcohol dehydrogenase-like predicted oxidoreductase
LDHAWVADGGRAGDCRVRAALDAGITTGPGPNDTGLSRKHIHEAINASLRRLKTDYVDLYQAHRFDYATPLTETMEAFADVVRAGKALYIGVSEWTAEQLREAHALAVELRISLVSNQPRYTLCTASSKLRWCRPARSSASARSCSPRWSKAS